MLVFNVNISTIVEMKSQILERNIYPIFDVLKLVSFMVASLIDPLIVFYYQIWQRLVPIKFGENHKEINAFLRWTNPEIPTSEISSIILILLMVIFTTLYHTRHVVNMESNCM